MSPFLKWIKNPIRLEHGGDKILFLWGGQPFLSTTQRCLLHKSVIFVCLFVTGVFSEFTASLSATSLTHWPNCFLTGSPHVSAGNFHLSEYSSWWSLSHQLESWLTDPATCLTRATFLLVNSMSHVLVGNLNIQFTTHKYAQKPTETHWNLEHIHMWTTHTWIHH